jgi:osmoprotectant transport system substrate-binding protein
MHGESGGLRRGCGHPNPARPAVAVVLVAVIWLMTACDSGDINAPAVVPLDDDVITVGSFDFAESVVIAEVYSQGLEAAGFKVRREFSLGPREFVGPALSTGLVEFVPEYAGTASEFYSLGNAEPTEDAAVTHAELVRAVSGDAVVALAAAPAEDSNTFVVTKSTAGRLHLQSLSDLAAVADQLTFGGPPECRTRQLCLLGLVETYGVTFGEFVTLDTGGPLTREALKQGVVDVALMFTTDPAIGNQGLVELADDRGLQPAESITPLVRTEIIDRWGPAVVDVIDAVSARLTTSVVRDLNGATLPPGTDVAAVAEAWWAQVGA